MCLFNASVETMVRCEIKLFQNYFSLRRRPSEVTVFQRIETCLKLFYNYFTGLLQRMNIFYMFIVAEINLLYQQLK